jgi:hypothetical protein
MPRSFAYRGRRVRTDPFLVVAENVRNDGTGEQAQSNRRSAELEGKHRRSKAVLLEKGVKATFCVAKWSRSHAALR